MSNMEVGEVRPAEAKDFQSVKDHLDKNEGWTLVYEKGPTNVWTRMPSNNNEEKSRNPFKMIKLKTVFPDVSSEVLFNVVQDEKYRKTWDKYMVEITEIGHLGDNDNVAYYAYRCPSPMKNRDFVLQSSWNQTGDDYVVISHSVSHVSYPPKKEFIRGISYLTGFVVKAHGPKKDGCELGYMTHCDPRGKVPSWLTNKVLSSLAPRLIKGLHKSCHGYQSWKKKHDPDWKPWRNPSQVTSPLILLSDCKPSEEEKILMSSNVHNCEDEDEDSPKDTADSLIDGTNGSEDED